MPLTQKRGLTGSALKWIAVLSMLIDHTAATLLFAAIQRNGSYGPGILSRDFYMAMRSIGRLGFPIFCFLLAEGFYHTRSRGKYLLRLGVFALLSEIPFDLSLKRVWKVFGTPAAEGLARFGLETGGQNVFFTLFFGLLAALLWDKLLRGAERDCPAGRGLAAILCALGLGAAAYYLHTDYKAMGVALVLVMVLLRDRPWTRDLAAGGILAAMIPFGSSWIELFGVLAFPLFHLYNGQRGRQSKYFFYAFYPGHLLLLALLARLLFVA